MTKSQNTKNEQQKDLCITVEKQVWESTLNRSMVLQAENEQLKKQINHLLRTQARQFVDNQKLQVKAEKAKDVVNIDTARQIKQLKELLKECELWFTGVVGNMNDKNFGEHNKSVPIGNFEYIFKVFSQKINEVLK